MTHEEVIKALRHCASAGFCMECMLANLKVSTGKCEQILMHAAADMLEQDARPADMVPTDFHDRCMELEIERRILLEQTHKKTVAEVCELRDQVHNLTLYLTEALALCQEDLKVLEDWHPGLPGYAPEKFTPRACLRSITISVVDGHLFCGQRGGETLPVVRYEGLIETDAGLIHCKDCTHLEYEDLGIYYCDLYYIGGQLSPDDYCSRATAREEANP